MLDRAPRPETAQKPGAAEMMGKIAQSSHPFDKWFAAKLAEIHGMDLTKPPPGPMPERKLSWNA